MGHVPAAGLQRGSHAALLAEAGMARQVMRGRSHALLQEAGINLVALVEEEGFYVRRRIMSAPLARRGRASFGAAAPIELPTPRELQRFAEGCGASMACFEPAAGPCAELAVPHMKCTPCVAAVHCTKGCEEHACRFPLTGVLEASARTFFGGW